MPNGTRLRGNKFNMGKDTSMNKKVIIGTLMGCLFGATVGYSASVVNLPHTFTAGTAIKASEVNANFSAIAQEVASIKSTVGIKTSSDFTEMAITPIVAAVGSTITVGTKSFIIKQKSDIEDPITGKKYTLNYPDLGETKLSYYVGCDSILRANSLVVRAGNGSGFTSYVGLKSFNYIPKPSTITFLSVKFSNNLCADFAVGGDQSFNHAEVSAMIDIATELQKYISVKEI